MQNVLGNCGLHKCFFTSTSSVSYPRMWIWNFIPAVIKIIHDYSSIEMFIPKSKAFHTSVGAQRIYWTKRQCRGDAEFTVEKNTAYFKKRLKAWLCNLVYNYNHTLHEKHSTIIKFLLKVSINIWRSEKHWIYGNYSNILCKLWPPLMDFMHFYSRQPMAPRE